GLLKLNVDATPGSENGAIDISVVVRDASGAICATLAKNFPRNFGFFFAGSLTFLGNLRFALNYNLIPKFVESDSTNVILTPYDKVSSSLEASILKDSSKYLSQLVNVSCNHVPRLRNNVAHNLAHLFAFFLV
ncbi:hypothetical protein TorRG33x02_305850, partial [Trema orientale]